MSLFTASLNSGSNGNCYYIGNDREAILVDAGLSCRETERRMKRLGLKMESVKALFISHEHGDHIKGVEGITAKHGIPVYITAATLHYGRLRIDAALVRNFSAHQPVSIGGLNITAFPKLHDAADAHSFTISGAGICIGVITDIGGVCSNVINHFSNCDAAFLEANYDEQMLASGRYPYHLKKRISGGFGHISNRQALELFVTHRSKGLSHLFLAHLSKENNCPGLVYDLFMQHAGNTRIVVASRDEPSSLFEITASGTKKLVKALPCSVQISLFA